MIDLITGLPGNAKTLYTIGMVKAWAEKENRPVYYSGIPELTLDWQQIDPTKWMDCPPKAIVVIDECQKIFRNRSLGAQPPKHVTDLETHRHLGIDLVFITQHPSLIDPAIRKLTQRHRHMVRVFGMEVSTVHQWDAVRDNCDKPQARKDSIKTKWKFDKSIYKLYKSADEHTFKRSIPFRLKMLFAIPFLLAGAGYFVYHTMVGKKLDKAPQVATVGNSAVPVGMPGQSSAMVQAKPFDPIEDARNYVQQRTPRVVGLDHTAPRYDALTEPVRVPVPAACIQRGSLESKDGASCKCYSQQGTPMQVEYGMCISFARNGYFQDFDPEQDRERSRVTDEGVRVMASKPDAPRSAAGSNVVVMPYEEPVSRLTGAPSKS